VTHGDMRVRACESQTSVRGWLIGTYGLSYLLLVDVTMVKFLLPSYTGVCPHIEDGPQNPLLSNLASYVRQHASVHEHSEVPAGSESQFGFLVTLKLGSELKPSVVTHLRSGHRESVNLIYGAHMPREKSVIDYLSTKSVKRICLQVPTSDKFLAKKLSLRDWMQ